MSIPALLTGLSVLVAEDDAANLEVACAMLKTLGAQVRSVDNGVAALESIVAHRPDIVLLDIEMPQMSGFDVLRKSHDLAPRPTMICLTAHVSPDYLDRAVELGANGTIGKPLRSIERFGMRISEIHGNRTGQEVPVLDRAVFDVLARAMGPDLVGGLIQQLGTDLHRCDAEMADAIADKALDRVRAQTHILTGVAGSVGAARLAVVSAQLNSAAHDGDDIALRELYPALALEIGAVLSVLRNGKYP